MKFSWKRSMLLVALLAALLPGPVLAQYTIVDPGQLPCVVKPMGLVMIIADFGFPLGSAGSISHSYIRTHPFSVGGTNYAGDRYVRLGHGLCKCRLNIDTDPLGSCSSQLAYFLAMNLASCCSYERDNCYDYGEEPNFDQVKDDGIEQDEVILEGIPMLMNYARVTFPIHSYASGSLNGLTLYAKIAMRGSTQNYPALQTSVLAGEQVTNWSIPALQLGQEYNIEVTLTDAECDDPSYPALIGETENYYFRPYRDSQFPYALRYDLQPFQDRPACIE